MFQFVRSYVFGVAATDDLNLQQPENNQQLATNIEQDNNLTKIDNDWILVNANEEIDDTLKASLIATDKTSKKEKAKTNINNNKSNDVIQHKVKNNQNANLKSKTASAVATKTSKTMVDDLKDENKNLVPVKNDDLMVNSQNNEILESTGILFDQMFVNKTPIVNNEKNLNNDEYSTGLIIVEHDILSDEIQQIFKKEDESKENKTVKIINSKTKTSKKSSNNKLVTSPFTGNNALTCVGGKVEVKKDKKKLKNNLSKGQLQLQNKVKKQRNGPIRRQIKMFQNLNGIYYNRNNC